MSDNKDIIARLRGGVFGLDRIPLCEEAATVISELRAEVERLRVDAERYRWLRDSCPGEIVFDNTSAQRDGHHFSLYIPFDGKPIANDQESAEAMGRAIDAASGESAEGGV